MFDRSWTQCSAVLCVALLGATPTLAPAAPLRIIAAENFYGDVARQLAGPDAQIASVLSNPAADPHLFEPDAATARAIARADVIIYNGNGYDPWMPRLLSSAAHADREVIEVAALMRDRSAVSPGIANPHLWYDPTTMPALAHALVIRLQRRDSAHAAQYTQRLQQFLASLQPLNTRIEQLRRRYAGTAVSATEPIAEDLTGALGLQMRNQRFQIATMNNTEPGARETAAFEQALTSHSVRLLIYNRQATDSAVQRLLAIARTAGVPVVPVTETEPPGVDYQQWMSQVLDALERALATKQP